MENLKYDYVEHDKQNPSKRDVERQVETLDTCIYIYLKRGGDFHMKGVGMLVRNFELNP